jgi:hypothetical protein
MDLDWYADWAFRLVALLAFALATTMFFRR